MKELIISKELISEILDIKLEDIVSFKMFGCELFYYQKFLLGANCQSKTSKHRDSIQHSINIYEFAYKCKRWLLKNNITFTLNYYKDNLVQFYCEKYHLDIESRSEIETIIKACEWILEQNK